MTQYTSDPVEWEEMNEQRFQIKVIAVGEARDAGGNLLPSEPFVSTQEVTESELRAGGLTEEQIRDIKQGVYS